MRSDIKVCLLKDYFWNNNSFVYPNTVPPLALYKRIDGIIPIFISPRTLTCVIEGDYNSAVYLGKYYRMIKLSVKDVDRQLFKYQLEEDIMMNFLLKGGKVIGTLTKTNNAELLEEHLQNTKPVLDNPREIVYLKYSTEDKYDWKKKAEVTIPVKLFEDTFFTQKSLGQLLWILSNNEVILAAKEKRLYRYADKDIYILGYAEGERVSSWKNTVLEKIREAFKTLEDKVITSPNKLPGYWSSFKAITPKTASIGSAEEESLIIREINLGGLKDITPIDLATGKRWMIGHSVPELDPKGIEIISNIDKSFCRKLSRQTYLPLYTGEKSLPKDAFLPIKSSYYTYLDNSVYTGYTGAEPQVIKLKNNSEGYLWYVDYLNFAFVDGSTFYPSNSLYAKRCLPSLSHKESSAYIFSADDPNAIPQNLLPGLGFLIFQLDKDKAIWDKLVTYKGGAKITNITYRSGLNNELFKTYSRSSWINLPDEDAPYWAKSSYKDVIEKINGIAEFSYLTLDIDLLLWLYIAPCTAGGNYNYQYRYNNDWGYREFLINYDINAGIIYHTPVAVRADLGIRKTVHPYNTILKQRNPFSKQRILRWTEKRTQKLKKISLSSSISLPYPINTGDIFTTDLTHKWTDITPLSVNRGHEEVLKTISFSASHVGIAAAGTALTFLAGPIGIIISSLGLAATTATHAIEDEKWWTQVFYTDHVLQDLFRGDKSNVSDIDGNVVIFLHENKLKFGIYHEYKQTQSLSKSEEQVVSSVDGEKERITTFYHIQQLPDNVIEGKITDTQIRAINIEQNKQYGGGVYINYLPEDLNQGVHMFKLEGTSWYAYISDGKVSLLTEDPTIFSKEIGNYAELQVPTELSSKSIYAKMNQKASLIVYGNEIVLNTKFKFNETDSLPLTDKSLNPDQTQSTIEYKLIEGGNKNDFISQWFGVAKKGLKSTEEINAQQIASLQLQLKHQNQNYHIEKWANELAVKEKLRGFKRRREDADFELIQNILGTAGNALSLGALTAVPAISGGTENLFMKAKSLIGVEGSRVNPILASKHAMFSGKYAGSITSAVGSVMAGMPRMAQHSWIKSRIAEDEQHFVQQNSLSMFTRDMRYTQEREDRIEKLNSISSSYVKAEITDRDIFTEYTKIKDLGDIYVQAILPSIDQEIEIEYIVENFGAECVIPMKHPLYVYDGMAPILVQFSRLEKAGISLVDGILSPEEHEALSQIFETGVKFVKFSHLASKEVVISYFTPEESVPVFDTENIDKWTKETWDQYVALTDRRDIEIEIRKKEHYGLTNEEYEKNKDKIRDDKLLEDINTIISGRGSGEVVVIHTTEIAIDEREKIIKPFLDDIKRINDEKGVVEEELKQAKTDIDKITQEKEACLNKAKSDIDRITAEKTAKEEELKTVRADIEKLSANKAAVDEELKQCKQNIENINKEKEDSNISNAQKIKELEQNLTSAVNRAETLSREYKDLETKKTEIENVSNLYKQQLDTIKKEGGDCEEVRKKFELEKKKVISEYKEKAIQLHSRNEGLMEIFKHVWTNWQGVPLMGDVCKVLKKYLTTSYTIDLKPRDDGGNALRDIIIFLIRAFKFMREDELDVQLTKVYRSELGVFFDYSLKFLEIPLVSKWEEILNTGGWEEYLHWYVNGGEQSEKVKIISPLIEEITGGIGSAFSMENVPIAHGIKAMLDEMNWITYKAKLVLKEKLEKDTKLQYFFSNIYPGKILPLYTAIFGDPNIEIAKRRFIESGDCDRPKVILTNVNPPSLRSLIELDRTTKHTIEDVAGGALEIHPVYNGEEVSSEREKITVGIAPKFIPNEFRPLPFTPLIEVRSLNARNDITKVVTNLKVPHISSFSLITGKGASTGERECYISVEKKDIWKEITDLRSQLWKDRANLSTENLDNYEWKRLIRLWYLSPQEASLELKFTEEVEINLMDIFGIHHALEASIILSILNRNKIVPSIWKREASRDWIRLIGTKVDPLSMKNNKKEIKDQILVSIIPDPNETGDFKDLREFFGETIYVLFQGYVPDTYREPNIGMWKMARGYLVDTEWFSIQKLKEPTVEEEVKSPNEMGTKYPLPFSREIEVFDEPGIPIQHFDDSGNLTYARHTGDRVRIAHTTPKWFSGVIIEGYWNRFGGYYINIFFEFANINSLINYIWRQIKNKSQGLEDPLSSSFSNIDFPTFLNKLYEENKKE